MPSRFLSKRFVLAMHRDLIDSFGGAHGLRDEAALESALAQPAATFGERMLHPTVLDQAAAYLFHLCTAHAFADGNKRVAFAAMDVFLRLNGYRLVLSGDDAYELTMGVARGEVGGGAIVKSIEERVVSA
ncbi:MAG: type II toxin-antitoxin system death-on-curing family toxin [Actinomycetota bacterium]|nr:type II toxin-antitoxin system death-on-curing family toxin [Actinomycetota bacterium]